MLLLSNMLSWESPKMKNCFLCQSDAGTRTMGDKMVCEDCHWRGAAEVLCECCGTGVISRQIVLDGYNTWVCAECPKRPSLMCNDCGEAPATRQFHNMCDDRLYDLCGVCFLGADHDPDYASTLKHLPADADELDEWSISATLHDLVDPPSLSNPVLRGAWEAFASQADVRTVFDEDYDRIKRHYERCALAVTRTYAEWYKEYLAIQYNFAVSDLRHAVREGKIDYSRNPETLESSKTNVEFHIKLCTRKYNTYKSACNEIEQASKTIARAVIKNWIHKSTCHCGAMASVVYVTDDEKHIRVCHTCLDSLMDAQ